MLIRRLPNAVEILAPAKVNLFLEVLGKRDDGYHAIDTIMCPVALYDRLAIERTDSREISLEVILPAEADPSDPAWDVPSDHRNLIVRGLDRVQRAIGTTHGCRVRVEKQIPAAAGLAGGSSDAAAAITAGLLLWGEWDRILATSVCGELGSDIPFFLGSETKIGLARATGRGESIELLFGQPSLEFALMHPPQGCSTAEVYRRVRVTNPRSSAEMIDACRSGVTQKIGIALFNALQSPAAGLTDWINIQLEMFRAAGMRNCSMSGSGSSCFALIDDSNGDRARVAIVEKAARTVGIQRFFQAPGHFCPSIESQI